MLSEFMDYGHEETNIFSESLMGRSLCQWLDFGSLLRKIPVFEPIESTPDPGEYTLMFQEECL
jgi:hypothetical protein